MREFVDTKGTAWAITLTVNVVKRVRDLTSFDLFGAFSAENLNRLGSDVVLLADVLCAILRPELEKTGVSDEQFAERLHGDAIDEANKALLDAIIDFFPNRQRRENLRAMLAAAERVTEKHGKRAAEKLQSGELEKLMDATIEKAIETFPAKTGERSIASPESSELTPAT